MSTAIRRKLTTILAADAEGYSRAMCSDEVRAFEALHKARDVFGKFIALHNGRIANTAGDGMIAEFPSVVEAVQCAIDVQRQLSVVETCAGSDAEPLHFRIGVHLGDVIVDGEDLLGEGVNLAARLQAMAEPGGILISQQVYDQVHNKLTVGFTFLGSKRPKNFAEDIPIYGVALAGDRPKAVVADTGRERPPSPDSVPEAQPGSVEPPKEIDTPRTLMRQFRWAGIAAAAFVAVDLATGSSVWAHWPVLVIAVVVGWTAVPALTRGVAPPFLGRYLVIVAALFVINLLTWKGTLWAIWPAGALAFLAWMRRWFSRTA